VNLRERVGRWLVEELLGASEARQDAKREELRAELSAIREDLELTRKIARGLRADLSVIDFRFVALLERCAPAGTMQRQRWLNQIQKRLDELIAEHNARVSREASPGGVGADTNVAGGVEADADGAADTSGRAATVGVGVAEQAYRPRLEVVKASGPSGAEKQSGTRSCDLSPV